MALRYFQAQYEIGGAFYGITLNGKYKRNNSTVIARRKSNGIHTNVYSAEIVRFKSGRGQITERIMGNIIELFMWFVVFLNEYSWGGYRIPGYPC